MNYRNRALLDLAYELDCTLRLPGICEGGRGEPAHANSATWGKGMGMKAHDFAFASACRACHAELDQGKKLSELSRYGYWMRGHVETMRQLWDLGWLRIRDKSISAAVEREFWESVMHSRREGLPEKEVAQPSTPHSLPPSRRRKKSRCTASSKTVPRPAGGFSP